MPALDNGLPRILRTLGIAGVDRLDITVLSILSQRLMTYAKLGASALNRIDSIWITSWLQLFH